MDQLSQEPLLAEAIFFSLLHDFALSSAFLSVAVEESIGKRAGGVNSVSFRTHDSPWQLLAGIVSKLKNMNHVFLETALR